MNKTIGRYRWRIVALLFFATTINYIDRQVLGILAPVLQSELGWTEASYGYIISVFQVAYAIGLLTSGRLLDKIGTRMGYSIAVTLWSLAEMLHAAFRNAAFFAGARFLLGLGEAANFPAAVKSVAEWFPKKERALATGIFNSGSNVGAIIAPIAVPWIALNWSWEWAFISSGLLGFIWLIFWLIVYKKPENHPKVSSAELEYIHSDSSDEVEDKQIPWKEFFTHRETIGICGSLFLTAPIWWFFLYWLPKFLNSNMHVSLANISLPLIIVYVVSDVGSILGGWISSQLIKGGKDPVAARKLTILILAFLVVPVFFASLTDSLWISVALIALATFAHQGYAANVFTLISDVYPKNAVASMTGLGLFAGSIGGVLFSSFVGLVLQHTGSYVVIFGIASVAYLISWGFLQYFIEDGKVVQPESIQE